MAADHTLEEIEFRAGCRCGQFFDSYKTQNGIGKKEKLFRSGHDEWVGETP